MVAVWLPGANPVGSASTSNVTGVRPGVRLAVSHPAVLFRGAEKESLAAPSWVSKEGATEVLA